MRFSSIIGIVVLTVTLLLIGGCTPYVVTIDLTQPLTGGTTCKIGEVFDELPPEMNIEDRPTIEEIDLLKSHLYNKIEEIEIFTTVEFGASDYEVRSRILEFKRGNGVLRFLFGIFANANAKIVVSLELVDSKTNTVMFAGNFRGEVTSWMMSGNEMYKMVSAQFVKELKKQIEKVDSQI